MYRFNDALTLSLYMLVIVSLIMGRKIPVMTAPLPNTQ